MFAVDAYAVTTRLSRERVGDEGTTTLIRVDKVVPSKRRECLVGVETNLLCGGVRGLGIRRGCRSELPENPEVELPLGPREPSSSSFAESFRGYLGGAERLPDCGLVLIDRAHASARRSPLVKPARSVWPSTRT